MSQFPQQSRNTPFDRNYDSRAGEMTVARFFNVVYAWMAVGLALTAVVAYVVSKTPALLEILYANRGIPVFIALGLFGLAWYVQSQVGRMAAGTATFLFLLYASVLGALISYIFIVYSQATLLSAFMLTAGVFGAMSIYGFITKRDLTRIGSIAVMLALGFIIASFVNVWLASNALSWIITYAILVLFVIITAYETQMLKNMATQLAHNPEMANRVAIVGALVLYISFINLFLAILRILGDRR